MNRLLSWPGAKHRQMKDILTVLPERPWNLIVEPFWGTGAFTWAVGGKPWPQRVIAAEADPHLLPWWEHILDNEVELVAAMALVREQYAAAGQDRDVFDQLRSEYNRRYAEEPEAIETAAHLWVLVYQSTNNLARFNSSGGYNQTWGKGRVVPDPEVIFGEEEIAALHWLGHSLAGWIQRDFREAFDFFFTYGDRGINTVVFLDPPYIVRTETYQRGCWILKDEQDMFTAMRQMDEEGILWLLTTYLEKGGIQHPFAAEIEREWVTVPLARGMDARPTGTGTPASEVIVLGKAAETTTFADL